ncbi:DUF359 domain-containing protein [Candidatus Bathyarchaeota archaeon]|nr:DUF359 domain-containing protein [Candidatus Bathyarchaeota archaeon]
MPNKHKFPPKLEEQLKKPWGKLIRGSYKETVQKIKKIVMEENPKLLITVGDAVSRNLVENGILPKLMIIDNKIMRSPVESSIKLKADEELEVENPPGTINEEAMKAIQRALEIAGRVKIVVNGEEDLLTPAAAFLAPKNSIIIYGQPKEGVVVVKVTEQLKAEAEEIIKAIKELRKTK